MKTIRLQDIWQYINSRHLLISFYRAFESAIFRFPMVLLNNVVGVYAAIRLTGSLPPAEAWYLSKLLLCCLVGFPSFLSLALLKERLQYNTRQRLFADGVGVLLLTVLYLAFSPTSLTPQDGWLFVLSLGSTVLLLSFVNFMSRYTDTAFWQFNRCLIERALWSGIYATILFGGVAVAFVSLNELFYLSIPNRVYPIAAILIYGIIANTHFLAGVPANIEDLEQDIHYPQQFLQLVAFVFFPLLLLYSFILYAYLVKILLVWALPKGWLSYLVLSYAILGIATLLMTYPIQQRLTNRWMYLLIRFFFPLLLPLLALNAVGIGVRIAEYGWTEARYFIVLFNVWLWLVSLYFIISKKKLLSFLPFTLCVLFLFALLSPWNIFSVSLKSQQSELIRLLKKSNALGANGLIRFHTDFQWQMHEQERIVSIIQFYERRHKLDYLMPLLPRAMDTLFVADKSERYRAHVLLNALQIRQDIPIHLSHARRIEVFTPKSLVMPVQGYDFMLTVSCVTCPEAAAQPVTLPGRPLFYLNFPAPPYNRLILQGSNHKQEVVIELAPLLHSIELRAEAKAEKNDISLELLPAELTIIQESDSYQAKLLLQSLYVEYYPDMPPRITHMEGQLLLRFID
ncbi:hypothetical protein FHS56_001772 [Thermonema lapsum]|uniref:DUF4153 domain-containing protein n=1 Tax=Thermonema lapsum TaxID=28195 RepID=A0A846MS25_9BACT|nr:DUF4153 domain-containing protein [Thermonema lapsum]NIK74259.1 hypothetical protein [Thermonema lapsum]